MNTVGRVIEKYGQLQFERFGAAQKHKIKLGTAAHADIVNEFVEQEGSVPDAVMVTELQTKITELEAQVQSLNSAIDITDDYAISWSSAIVYRDSVKIVKLGRMINLSVIVTINKPGSSLVLCEIKEKYAPTLPYNWGVLMKNSSNFPHNGMVQMNANPGTISLHYPDINVNTQVFFNFCYFTRN